MDDSNYVHIKVFKALSQKVSLSAYELNKTVDDEIEYF